MRAAVVLSLALALMLAPATGDAAPAPPYAFTLDARDITLTAATLRATVNPNGSAASFHFEYGTSTSYDHQTAEQDAGSGSGDLTVETAISGLADTTIFHFRIVVSGPGGEARGFDQTFRTREPPRAPTISTAGADDVAATSVTMTGSLDPHDEPTTFHFDYGLTSSYGSRTPDVAVTGYGSRVVRQPVTGLNVAATYHYRLVAVNASGTSIGRDQTVATRRDATAITVHTDSDAYPVWGDVVTLVGRVRGRGIGGIPLAVTRQDFPFTGDAREIARLTAGDDGSFKVRVGPLGTEVRLRIVTGDGPGGPSSPVVELANRVRVGVVRRPATRSRFVLAGLVRPHLPGAIASVQRQTRSGGWRSLAHGRLFDDERGRSRYEIRVARPERSAALRVVVLPNDGGAHVRGFSRALKIKGRI